MTLPAVLSPEAEADLDEAAAWHEQQSQGLGVDLVSEVRHALTRVGDQPEGYPELRPGVRRAQVRRFSYGIFYRVRADRVEVIESSTTTALRGSGRGERAAAKLDFSSGERKGVGERNRDCGQK